MLDERRKKAFLSSAALWACLSTSAGSFSARAFPPARGGKNPLRPPPAHRRSRRRRLRSTSLSVIDAGVASLLAGSAGGALGAGAAYPFDTLKTRAQARRGSDAVAPLVQKDRGASGSIALSSPPRNDMISTAREVLEMEGVGGFFAGVGAMMLGKALIKSVAFGSYQLALGAMGATNDGAPTQFATLLAAASLSGFITSFIVAPTERAAVMMQAQGSSTYSNEVECIRAVLKHEGWLGLFSRGLVPTMAREIPSYGIYFAVHGALLPTAFAGAFGGAAPLVCGAISGCACWMPVLPIDAVKTRVQNTEGRSRSGGAVDAAMQIYEEDGVGAFFRGFSPILLHATLNSAVTFWVYDSMMDVLV